VRGLGRVTCLSVKPWLVVVMAAVVIMAASVPLAAATVIVAMPPAVVVAMAATLPMAPLVALIPWLGRVAHSVIAFAGVGVHGVVAAAPNGQHEHSATGDQSLDRYVVHDSHVISEGCRRHRFYHAVGWKPFRSAQKSRLWAATLCEYCMGTSGPTTLGDDRLTRPSA
jgi:hypothetical protein